MCKVKILALEETRIKKAIFYNALNAALKIVEYGLNEKNKFEMISIAEFTNSEFTAIADFLNTIQDTTFSYIPSNEINQLNELIRSVY